MITTNDVTSGRPQYEFGGPQGVAITMVMFPIVVLALNYAAIKEATLGMMISALFDMEAFQMYFIWFVFQLLLFIALPGPIKLGQPLKSGKRLHYILNGWTSLKITLLTCVLVSALGFPLYTIYDHMFGLLLAAMLVSFTLSWLLYKRAYYLPSDSLTEAASTSSMVYKMYMGCELNPRVLGVDWKYFCELRPGLLGWIVVDLVVIVKAWSINTLTPSLVLACLFHFIYVADALYYEESVLTTVDIVSESFGFMLIFGDLTFVPFTFTLTSRHHLYNPQTWSNTMITVIAITNVLGYALFRQANNEKDEFKRTTAQNATPTVPTLLQTGWWGICRHPNYLGDIMMALSWSMLCGFSSCLPWFYSFYLVGALIHRCGRLEHKSLLKYGTKWHHYCKHVPYKIVPGIY